MESSTVFFWALLAIGILTILARVLKKPDAIIFMIGGLIIGLLPGLPRIETGPDVVFLFLLPPLLFGEAWTIEYRDFKRWRRPIAQLALGLVLLTTIAVAYAAHAFIGLPLATAFVLGAILAPTDAIAVEAAAQAVRLPRPVVGIARGESLVNDASALVVYRFAVATVTAGTFSWFEVSWRFLYVSIVGVAIGYLVSELLARLLVALRKMNIVDEPLTVVFSLVTPYLLYILADSVGASGVLAAVTGGIMLSRQASRIFTSGDRVSLGSIWQILDYGFNGVAFLIIGLELRPVLAALHGYTPWELIGYGLGLSLLVTVVRFAWMFPATYLPRWTFPSIRRSEGPDPPWTWTAILGWSGIRGVVTLAAALAIPRVTADGSAFPGRDLVVFLASFVIVFTLVVQSTTLPWLARRLGAVADGSDDERALSLGRVEAAAAGRAKLKELESSFASAIEWEVASRIYAYYDQRLTHYQDHLDGNLDGSEDGRQHEIDGRFRRETYAAEREALERLRREGAISEAVYRHLQWDIDLAESRLSEALV